MSTTAQEVTTWESDYTQTFGAHGEKGVDIGLAQGTPVYAPLGGTVVATGVDPCIGGVVTWQANLGGYGGINGPANLYIQHLDTVAGLTPGQTIPAGAYLGTSGGQTGGGNYNSQPACSSGPHIEFGINSPSQGTTDYWHAIGPNVDPRGLLASLASGNGAPLAFSQSGNPSAQTLSDPLNAIGSFLSSISGLSGWLGAPLRIIKFISGFAFIGYGVLVAFWPEAAGLVSGVATTAVTGDPLAGAKAGTAVRQATRAHPVTAPAGIGAQVAASRATQERRERAQAETRVRERQQEVRAAARLQARQQVRVQRQQVSPTPTAQVFFRPSPSPSPTPRASAGRAGSPLPGAPPQRATLGPPRAPRPANAPIGGRPAYSDQAHTTVAGYTDLAGRFHRTSGTAGDKVWHTVFGVNTHEWLDGPHARLRAPSGRAKRTTLGPQAPKRGARTTPVRVQGAPTTPLAVGSAPRRAPRTVPLTRQRQARPQTPAYTDQTGRRLAGYYTSGGNFHRTGGRPGDPVYVRVGGILTPQEGDAPKARKARGANAPSAAGTSRRTAREIDRALRRLRGE